MKRRVIPISALASLGYCERYLYLTRVLGAKPAPTGAMRTGVRQHSVSRALDPARRYLKEEIPALGEKLRSESSTLELPREVLRVAFAHEGYLFRGRVDKLVKRGSEVTVMEEKFVARSYGRLKRSHEYQLSGYCHALKEGKAGYAFGRNTLWFDRNVFANLKVNYMVIERHRETREVLFASPPISYSKRKFLPVLERLVGILDGEVEPVRSRGAKCRVCSLAESCARTRG